MKSRSKQRQLTIQSLETRRLLAVDMVQPQVVAPEGEAVMIGSQESEPNNRFSDSNDVGTITTDHTIEGQLSLASDRRYLGLPRTVQPDYFKFSIAASDSLLVEVSSPAASFEFAATLFDANRNQIGARTVVDDGQAGFLFEEGLSAGEYFLQIDAGAVRVTALDRITEYSMTLRKGALTPPAVTESEPNDSFAAAQSLGRVGDVRVTGDVGFTTNPRIEDIAMFRYEQTTSGDLELSLSSPFSGTRTNRSGIAIEATVFDADQNQVRAVSIGPSTEQDEFVIRSLASGNYFLTVNYANQSGNVSRFGKTFPFSINLRSVPEPSRDREIESNDDLDSANYIGLLGSRVSARGQMQVESSEDSSRRTPESDYFRFDVESKGDFRIQAAMDFVRHDPSLQILDSEGGSITTLAFANGNRDSSRFQLNPGTYYAKLTGRENQMGFEIEPNYEFLIERVAIPNALPINGREIEENNTLATANDLGELQSVLTVGGVVAVTTNDGRERLGHDAKYADPDYFTFNLDTATTADVTVTLSVDEIPFPLTVSLLNEDGEELKSAPLQEILANRLTEELSSGSYFVVIDSPPNPVGTNREPNYSLVVTREDNVPPDVDRYDTPVRNDQIANATSFDSAGDYTGLTIHEESDRDLFRIELPREGVRSDQVELRLDGLEIDFDLQILNIDGDPALISDTNGDLEALSLDGLPAGTYFVEVYGVGESIGTYDLNIDIATILVDDVSADGYEPNDSRETATDLLAIEGTVKVGDLTIHVDGGSANEDYFSFVMTDSGTAFHWIEAYTPSVERIELTLYGEAGEVLEERTNRLSLLGIPRGRYVVGVTSQADSGFQYGIEFSAPIRKGEFNVELDIDPSVSATVRSALLRAKSRIESIVTNDLPDIEIPAGVVDKYPRGLLIDDIHIAAFETSVPDDPSSPEDERNTLAYAGGIPRPNEGLPFLGQVVVNTDLVPKMLQDGNLDNVLLHELIHALTSPRQLWSAYGLVSGGNFVGANAVTEYQVLTQSNVSSVPLESSGGEGTAGAHWDLGTFGNELMVGWAGPDMRLSRVTIGMLEDMGYEVDYSRADPYSLPSSRLVAEAESGSATSSETQGFPLDLHDAELPLFMQQTIQADVPVVAQDLQILFPVDAVTLGLESSSVVKTQSSSSGRVIRGLESHVTKLVLPREGSFGNRVSVASEIDRPLAIELHNESGDVVKLPLDEDQNTISLNGLDAGEYDLVVTSEDHNRYVIATDFDLHEIITRLNASAADPANRTNHVSQPTSYARQRSDAQELSIELPIRIDRISAADITLTNLGTDTRVDQAATVSLQDDQLSVQEGGRTLTIQFEPNNLADGVYRLEISSAATRSEPLVITGNANNGLFVLHGDFDGNGSVDFDDFASIGYWFDRLGETVSTAPSYLDLDHSGSIDAIDLVRFQDNLGDVIVFPDGTIPTSGGSVDQELVRRAVRSVVTPADSNGDGDVTSADAFAIINELSRGMPIPGAWDPLDTTRDGTVTALDALVVINHLETTNQRVLPSNIDAEFAIWPASDEARDEDDWLDGFVGILFG